LDQTIFMYISLKNAVALVMFNRLFGGYSSLVQPSFY